MPLEVPPIIAADPKALFHRVWPTALIILGLGVSVAWTALLGYGAVTLVRMAL